MKHKTTLLFQLVNIVLITSCNQTMQTSSPLSNRDMLSIVKENDKKFSVGVRTKDAALLANIYSESAQYVQPFRKIIVGKDSIQKDWAGFVSLKENPVDLILEPLHVDGNQEIIYETGYGYTLLADSSQWKFNYVNVWRLQKDGSYKLEIDTFNSSE